jgi:hypothetical protein
MGVTATFFDGDTSFLFLFTFLRGREREKGADGGAGEWKRKGFCGFFFASQPLPCGLSAA